MKVWIQFLFDYYYVTGGCEVDQNLYFSRIFFRVQRKFGVLLEYPTATGFQWGHLKNDAENFMILLQNYDFKLNFVIYTLPALAVIPFTIHI